jgi:hypothetical protein
LGRRIPPLAVVLAMGLVITCAEAAIRAPVFGSLYNWFHLP